MLTAAITLTITHTSVTCLCPDTNLLLGLLLESEWVCLVHLSGPGAVPLASDDDGGQFPRSVGWLYAVAVLSVWWRNSDWSLRGDSEGKSEIDLVKETFNPKSC